MRTVSVTLVIAGLLRSAGSGLPSAWPEKISSPLLFFRPP